MGEYRVKGQTRCRDHTDVESAWRDAITIQVVEGVTQPADISGPGTGTVGQPATFITTGSTSSEGHDLEYRLYVSTSAAFLGVPQTWLPIDGLTHTFNSAGTFYIRVQARCTTHLTESNVSAVSTSITISQP